MIWVNVEFFTKGSFYFSLRWYFLFLELAMVDVEMCEYSPAVAWGALTSAFCSCWRLHRSRYTANFVCFEHVALFCFLGWDFPFSFIAWQHMVTFCLRLLLFLSLDYHKLLGCQIIGFLFYLWIFKKSISVMYIINTDLNKWFILCSSPWFYYNCLKVFKYFLGFLM